MKISYLDKHGLVTLMKVIKKGQSNVYRVKGQAIYADQAFVDMTTEQKEAFKTGAGVIDSVGLWQIDSDESWSKVTEVAEGAVYDIINKFTTDSNFREGAGHQCASGTNIVAVNLGSAAAPVMKFDLLGGLADFDKYQTKELVDVEPPFENEAGTEYATAEDLPEMVAKGSLEDGALAVLGGTGDEAGDVYEAEVTAIENDPVHDAVTWTRLGNPSTVEGALSLIFRVCPNRPLTDKEIEDIWANA